MPPHPKRFVICAAFALTLTDCAGNSSLPRSAGNDNIFGARAKIADSDACLTATCIYELEVGGSGRKSPVVLAYPSDAAGDAAPIQAIYGQKAGLNSAQAIAVDLARNIYVADGFEYGPQSVVVFAAGSQGDASAMQTITGPDTQLAMPDGLAVDAAGDIYVANNAGGSDLSGSVTEYAPGANGDATPLRQLLGYETGIIAPAGVALDSNGFIYVLNKTSQIYDQGPSVTVFRAGSNGDSKPVRTITGPNTGFANVTGIAVDASGQIYVSGSDFISSEVLVFGSDAKGNVAPSAIIEGSATGLFDTDGVGVDAQDNVYASNLGNGNRGFGGSVTVYGAGADGNQSPVRDIAGRATKLRNNYGIAVR